MFSVFYVTAPSTDIAQRIATSLVEKRLAACVNLMPGVTSIYRWEGNVQQDTEVLLMAKTQTHLMAQCIAEVTSLHPYSVPEVISVPMGMGHMDYLKWVKESTTPMPTTATATAADDVKLPLLNVGETILP